MIEDFTRPLINKYISLISLLILFGIIGYYAKLSNNIMFYISLIFTWATKLFDTTQNSYMMFVILSCGIGAYYTDSLDARYICIGFLAFGVIVLCCAHS